jgi:hypothetical protein
MLGGGHLSGHYVRIGEIKLIIDMEPLKSFTSITYDSPPGHFINASARTAINISITSHVIVKFIFNEITLYCHPGMKWEDLVDTYHYQLSLRPKKRTIPYGCNSDIFFSEDEFKMI